MAKAKRSILAQCHDNTQDDLGPWGPIIGCGTIDYGPWGTKIGCRTADYGLWCP